MEIQMVALPTSSQLKNSMLLVFLLALVAHPVSALPLPNLPLGANEVLGSGPSCCNTCELEGSSLMCENYFYNTSDYIANCKSLVCHPVYPLCVCRDPMDICPPACTAGSGVFRAVPMGDN
uniref:Sensory neuron membrane protein 1 n=1 Tax=Anthurium amnicola TaxID=1678845 RepID=A0A1D1XUB0_9ARAE